MIKSPIKIANHSQIKGFSQIKGISDIESLSIIGTTNTGTEYYNIIRYFGGKFNMLNNILPYIEELSQLNQAHTYIECFGGGGKCILNLDTINNHFKKKIYNEYDQGLCSLFKVASSSKTVNTLVDKLMQVEYEKETFDMCKKHRYDKNLSELDRAAITFILCQMSYNANMSTFCKIDYDPNTEDRYYNTAERLRDAPEHLIGLEVSNRDYKEVMEVYGADPGVIKYLDPPYHPATRNQDSLKVYPNELTIKQHKEMVQILCRSRNWIMSGYDPAQYGCNDYKPLEEAGAIKISIGTYSLSSSNLIGKEKEEFIWIKG